MRVRLNISFRKEIIIAFFFSISYFLSIYNLPGIEINAGYFPLMFIAIIYIALSMGSNSNWENTIVWKTFSIMGLYIVLNHLFIRRDIIYNSSETNIISILSFLLFIFLFIQVFRRNKVLIACYSRCMENIAIVMSVVVIMQSILYYVFGTSVSYDRSFLLPFQNLLTDVAKEYLAQTTMVSSGMFRPSAFFLEPAHFAQFCSIGLASLLLNEKTLFNKKAIIVSIGMILTTSGIGIACVAYLWMIALLLYGDGFTTNKLIRIVLGIILGTIAFLIAYFSSSTFQKAVLRIFMPSEGFQGRLWSRVLLDELDGIYDIFGMGYKNIPVYGANKTHYYMTGIIEMRYCQGFLGSCVFGIMYFLMMMKAKKNNMKTALIIMCLFLPFYIGSSCLGVTTLCSYIPYLYELNKPSY